MSQRQIFALIGAALLGIGAFTPLIAIPIAGEMSLLTFDAVATAILLAAIAAVAVAALFPRLGLLFPGGVGAAVAAVVWAAGLIWWRMRYVERVAASQTDDLARSISGLVAVGVHPRWGWGLLVVGSLALAVAVAKRDAPAPLGVDSAALGRGAAAPLWLELGLVGGGALAAVLCLMIGAFTPAAMSALTPRSFDVVVSPAFDRRGSNLHLGATIEVKNTGGVRINEINGTVTFVDGANVTVGTVSKRIAGIEPGATGRAAVSTVYSIPDGVPDEQLGQTKCSWVTDAVVYAENP